MKLSAIVREAMLPTDTDDASAELAGSDPTVQAQVKKQLAQQHQQQQKDGLKQERELKRSVQSLANVQWDPKDSRFQKLAAKVMGATKT